MPLYIALLRGINVGGKNKIKMPELRTALESAGLQKVETYIASGNVLFETERAEEEARAVVENTILDAFGIRLNAMLRTAEEWQRIVREAPFREEDLPEGGSLQLSLLLAPLTEEQTAKVLAGISSVDEMRIIGRELYAKLGQSILDSKLMENMGKLKDQVTTRNWNTVKKLADLAAARR